MFFLESGFLRHYAKLLVLVSIVLCLVQIVFQIIVASLGNDLVTHCGSTELLLRHVGLVRLDNLDAVSITQWIAPEVISLLGSSFVLFLLTRAAKASSIEATIEESDHNRQTDAENSVSPEIRKNLESVGKVMSLMALCATGALQPSILSFAYYIVFLGAATWWACNKKLGR